MRFFEIVAFSPSRVGSDVSAAVSDVVVAGSAASDELVGVDGWDADIGACSGGGGGGDCAFDSGDNDDKDGEGDGESDGKCDATVDSCSSFPWGDKDVDEDDDDNDAPCCCAFGSLCRP